MRKVRILLLSFALVIGIVWLARDTRDRWVFPGAFDVTRTRSDGIPKYVEQIWLDADDGEQLEVWRVAAAGKAKAVIILFHGDSGDVTDLYPIQTWFAELGITSYSFDYRGFGLSSGWPDEVGVLSDVNAIRRSVIKREGDLGERLGLFGISFGTGPAAYASTLEPTGLLILVAPYTSLIDCDYENFWFGPAMPYFWYDFPIREYLPHSEATRIVLVHGSDDQEIPWSHTEQLSHLTPNISSTRFILKTGSTHDSVLDDAEPEIQQELSEWLERCKSSGSALPSAKSLN